MLMYLLMKGSCERLSILPALLRGQYLGTIQAVELKHEDGEILADRFNHHQESNHRGPNAPAQLHKPKETARNTRVSARGTSAEGYR